LESLGFDFSLEFEPWSLTVELRILEPNELVVFLDLDFDPLPVLGDCSVERETPHRVEAGMED
jgi:hypothetical protein